MPCLPQTSTTCFLSQRVGRHVLGFYISGIGQYVSASLIQHSIHVVTCISNSFPFCWLVVWSRWAAFGKMRWEGDALRKEWACVQAGMKRKREDSEPQGPAGSQSQLRLESYLTAEWEEPGSEGRIGRPGMVRGRKGTEKSLSRWANGSISLFDLRNCRKNYSSWNSG